MSNKSPSYITKNRLGIFCFQYSYAVNIDSTCIPSKNRKLFRKSLRTRDRAVALIAARYLWLAVERIRKKYFSNPKLYGQAMDLLSRYEAASLDGWEAVDQFLSKLDADDDRLLTLGIEQQKEDAGVGNHGSVKYEDLLSHLNAQIKSKALGGDTDKESPIIGALVAKWLESKQRTLKPGSLESARSHIAVFCKGLIELNGGECRVGEITPDLMRQFNDLLQGLPARRSSRKIANMSFLELSRLEGLKISSKTYHYYVNTIIDFLNWMESQGYIENTRFKSILQSSKKSVPKRSSNNRVPFSTEDLTRIFMSNEYLGGKFKRSSDYWVPLIALFTGARLGEICQLSISDIREIDGVLCFDINENEEYKSIKSKQGSARTIPVHKILISLDIKGYIDYLKKLNQNRLFPLERRTALNKFDAIQKRIANRFKTVGILSDQYSTRVFHSFRHTVRTQLVDQNIEERTIDSIVGHSSAERSIGSKVYTHSKLTKQKLVAINRLTYPLDFEKIKPWSSCLFKRVEAPLITLNNS